MLKAPNYFDISFQIYSTSPISIVYDWSMSKKEEFIWDLRQLFDRYNATLFFEDSFIQIDINEESSILLGDCWDSTDEVYDVE